MYLPKPQVLDSHEWLKNRIREIRNDSLTNGRKIDYIRIQAETYEQLEKNFEKYSPFEYKKGNMLLIYGIRIKPYDFDDSRMVEPIWKWQTLQGIY